MVDLPEGDPNDVFSCPIARALLKHTELQYPDFKVLRYSVSDERSRKGSQRPLRREPYYNIGYGVAKWSKQYDEDSLRGFLSVKRPKIVIDTYRRRIELAADVEAYGEENGWYWTFWRAAIRGADNET